ncbi:MAG: serine hydrolase [Gemmatimonadales bacterium]|nr:serine hydrolase [Gemmatimonadales bacterium]
MTRAIRAVLSVTILLISVPGTAPAQARSDSLAAQVDSLFADLTPHTPGAAVLVVRDGKVLYQQGYGSANLEHGVPITTSTVFDIASVSKQFAGMAIAMLTEQGVISLDDDVRTHIPELPDFGHTITVRHLVHHTSGIRDWPGTLAVAGWRMDDVISFDQILTMVWNQRDLNFEPGAEHLYSNTGYNLLAELVERVTGQTFREWTDANIFQPLGMTSTHFHDDHTEVVANRAYGYARAEDRFRAVPNGLTALGSSSLFTTVDDLAKWVINLDDGRVGGRAVIERMYHRGTLNDGSRIAYAFGLGIGEYRGLKRVSHGGSWAAFRTVLMYFPEQHFGVVVLCNFSPVNPTRRAYQIADIYLADALGPRDPTTDPHEAEPVRVPTDILDDYVGVYRLGPAWYVTITRDGDSLMTQATAEDSFPMTARSDSTFWVQDYGAAIVFRRDSTGQVTHFSYRGMSAPRVEAVQTAGPEQFPEFEGEYYSDELGTSYTIAIEDGRLVARHRRHGTIELTPAFQGEFRGSEWFLRAAEFYRDDAGRVAGMLVTNGRSRNLRFVRGGR